MKQIPSHSVNADQQALQYDIYDYLSTREQMEQLVKGLTTNNEELRDRFFYNTADEEYNMSACDFKYYVGFINKNYPGSKNHKYIVIHTSNDYLEIKKELQKFILVLKYFRNKKYSVINYSKELDAIHITIKNYSIKKPNYLKMGLALSKKLMTSVTVGVQHE